MLNEHFQILTFQRYQHDRSSGFEEAVGRYATKLAEKMNTVLGSKGVVPNLVATEWHDDGAVAGAQGYFDIDGAVGRAIKAAPKGEKLTALLSMVSPSQLTSQLSLILQLAQHVDCQTFQQNFLCHLAEEAELMLRHRIELATFAREQGLTPWIKVFMSPVKIKSLLRFLKREYCCEFCSSFVSCGTYQVVFGMLVDLNPSVGLRGLRSIQPVTIRDDESDKNKYRRPLLALAHRRLGRTVLADRLLQK